VKQIEGQIFSILTESDIETLGDQKRVVHAIAALFPPPCLTYYALKGIVEQLRFCEYECKGGPLVLNTAFVALEELANLTSTF